MNRAPFDAGERFGQRVTINTATGCWEWIGAAYSNGYGRFWDREAHETVLAHRYAYRVFVGGIPEGLDLDHLCRVRHCCNPDHLEPVTRAENLRRSPITIAVQRAARTHCQKGHEFTPENTYYYTRSGTTERTCRACERLRGAQRRATKPTKQEKR